VLLQALADFPVVLSRRIDAEAGADSPWHDVGRALIAQGTALQAPVRAAVELVEFGRCAILVDGKEERPRIAKAYELLAFLVTRAGTEAGRGELLDALFDGRVDESTRSYLRQAARWLRHTLPDEGALVVEGGRMRLGDDVLATSESTRFESALAVAARLQGDERLTATVEALAVFDRGEYLPGIRSHWVDERRQRLNELATDARYEAAELAFAAGILDQADRLAAHVLTADPFREAAWRLTMRIASALGDDDGVIRAYQRCERALARLGTEPAPSTRELLGRLRR
jgi:DNA-binding SARP family transcriptional activator